jgi:hypothetical protein
MDHFWYLICYKYINDTCKHNNCNVKNGGKKMEWVIS